LEIDDVQASTTSSNSTNLENCEFIIIENVQFGSIVNPCISQVGKDITCSNRDDGTERKLPSCGVIGCQVLRSDGVYVMGQVQGSDINFTVDTGSARTVLSRQAFSKIPESKKPYLKKSNTLASADGKPLQELGKTIFNIHLGDLHLDIEL
jgi:hypothetical protein